MHSRLVHQYRTEKPKLISKPNYFLTFQKRGFLVFSPHFKLYALWPEVSSSLDSVANGEDNTYTHSVAVGWNSYVVAVIPLNVQFVYSDPIKCSICLQWAQLVEASEPASEPKYIFS